MFRAVLLLAACTSFMAFADESSAPLASRVPVVRARGSATVTAPPDQAEITIGVTNQAPTAQEAAAQNARQTDAVMAKLKPMIGSEGKLQTANYSVNAQYNYGQGKAPKVTGYEASNSVRITLRDLSLLPKLIDSATSAGANDIRSIQFGLHDDNVVRAKALAAAAQQARTNAEAIATALKLKVQRVLEAQSSESSNVRPLVRSPMMAMRAEAAPPPTPIEAGSIEFQMSVDIVVEVAP